MCIFSTCNTAFIYVRHDNTPARARKEEHALSLHTSHHNFVALSMEGTYSSVNPFLSASHYCTYILSVKPTQRFSSSWWKCADSLASNKRYFMYVHYSVFKLQVRKCLSVYTFGSFYLIFHFISQAPVRLGLVWKRKEKNLRLGSSHTFVI